MTTRRIITAILALVFSLQASAQQTEAFTSFMATAAESRIEFTYSFVSGALQGSGNAVVQDDCFLVNGNGLKIACDGRTLWTIDSKAREAVVESLDISDADVFLANPALLVGNLDSMFRLRSSHSATVNGKAVEKLTLEPVVDDDIKSLVACITPDGTRLVQLVAIMKDGTATSFTIPSFKFVGKSDSSMFSVNGKEFDSSWVITDFR